MSNPSYVLPAGSHTAEAAKPLVGTPGVRFSDKISEEKFNRIQAQNDAVRGPTLVEAGIAPELTPVQDFRNASKVDELLSGRTNSSAGTQR